MSRVDQLFAFDRTMGPRIAKKARKLLDSVEQMAYKYTKSVGGEQFLMVGVNVTNPQALESLKQIAINFSGTITKDNVKYLEREVQDALIASANAITAKLES